MTANAEARALLDQLMGVERDALLPAGAALPRKNKRHHLGGTDHNHGGMVLPGVKKSRSCYDRDIDPLFCVWGVDVYELFVNTKSDIGPNPYKVDEAARNEYLSLAKEDRDKLGFDARLFGKLQELVQHCDRTVNRNHEKLKREIQRQSQKRGGNDYVVDVSEEKVEEVVQAECRLEDAKKDLVEALATLKEVQEKEEGVMEEQRKKQTKEQQTNETDEAESVVEKGKDGDTGEAPAKEGEDESSSSTNTSSKIVIDREGTETSPPDFNAGLEELGKLTLQRQNLLCKIATIISQLGPMEENIEVLHAKLNFVRSDTTTDKIVCKVSGNFMSARDADERMAAHYAGKQYVGWKLVRDKYQEMVQKYGRYGPPRPTNRDGGAAPLMPHQKHQMQQGGGAGYGGGGRDRYRGRGGDDRRGGGSSYGGGPRDGGGGRWERGAEGYGGGGYRGGDGRGGHDDRRRGGGGGYGDRDRDRGGYRGGGGSYSGYGRR